MAAAVAASYAAGTPPAGEMPGVALGWSLLLHIERATGMLAILTLVALVVWRASIGGLPIKLGHLEYEDAKLRIQVEAAVEAFDKRLEALEPAPGSRPLRPK